VFSVTDTGIGIAPDNLAVIFGAFQQGDSTLSRRYGGTGLGLSIAREVAALLGGEITADSRLGSGTTFTLRVPSTLPGATDRDGQDTLAGSSRRRNVLVYERSAEGVCTLIARSAVGDLDGAGETVTIRTASTPEQGARMLAAEPAQCVVADLGTASAFEFLEHVQTEPALQDIPALAYLGESEHSAVQPRLQSLRSGGDTRVEVLPSLEDLSDRIRLHLSAGAHVALRGKKVLVIEDDERNVFAIASALEMHGAEVTRAGDGRAGIDALIAAPGTDVVLLDIMMPEMDGYATLTVIRQMAQFADLPVVVVTARATPADRDKSLQAGASDCVTKPVDIEELLACVERLLARG
jgi:CheY-like chemotaxis protein